MPEPNAEYLAAMDEWNKVLMKFKKKLRKRLRKALKKIPLPIYGDRVKDA